MVVDELGGSMITLLPCDEDPKQERLKETDAGIVMNSPSRHNAYKPNLHTLMRTYRLANTTQKELRGRGRSRSTA